MIHVDTVADSASALDNDLLPTDDHYRLTGELAKPEESQPSIEEQEAELARENEEVTKPEASSASERETAAEPRTAQPQEKRESKSEKRWRELSERVGNLQRENDELKRRTAPAAEVRETPAPQPAAAEASSGPPKWTDTNPATGKPFQTLDEWNEAHAKWMEKQLDTRLAREREDRQQTETERILNEGLQRKFEPARDKYADFDEVALGPHLIIPKGSAADLFVHNSEISGELAYYLGQHPEITKKWYSGDSASPDFHKGKFRNEVPVFAQIRELTRIEHQLSSEPAPEKKAPTTSAPAKRVTNAPAPVNQVSGRATTSLDEVEKSVEDGDQGAFAAAANARDIARMGRRKGR